MSGEPLPRWSWKGRVAELWFEIAGDRERSPMGLLPEAGARPSMKLPDTAVALAQEVFQCLRVSLDHRAVSPHWPGLNRPGRVQGELAESS